MLEIFKHPHQLETWLRPQFKHLILSHLFFERGTGHITTHVLGNIKNENSSQNFWGEVQQSGIKIKWLCSAISTHGKD